MNTKSVFVAIANAISLLVLSSSSGFAQGRPPTYWGMGDFGQEDTSFPRRKSADFVPELRKAGNIPKHRGTVILSGDCNENTRVDRKETATGSFTLSDLVGRYSPSRPSQEVSQMMVQKQTNDQELVIYPDASYNYFVAAPNTSSVEGFDPWKATGQASAIAGTLVLVSKAQRLKLCPVKSDKGLFLNGRPHAESKYTSWQKTRNLASLEANESCLNKPLFSMPASSSKKTSAGSYSGSVGEFPDGLTGDF